MAFRILRPVERRSIQFSDNATTDSIMLARRINVAAFKEVTAYVRVHSLSAAPNTSNFIINADGYTDEDPASLFGNLLGFQTQLSLTNVQPLGAGMMQVIPVVGPLNSPWNLGSLLSLQWQVKTAALGVITMIVSVDLICKEF